MRNIIVLFILFGLTQNVLAQNSVFEKKASQIAQRIDSITSVEKRALKKELKRIDKKLDKKEFTAAEAEAEKKRIAEVYAERINNAVALEEQKLQTLIRNKVSGNIATNDDESNTSFSSIFGMDDNYYKDSITGLKVEKRWTSQFVVALGANIISGDTDGFYGDGFKTSPFGYGEVGFSFKYRLKESDNLWNLKLGFSTMIDEIRPEKDDDIFVTNGNQTTLQDSGFNIRRSYLSSVYIGLPVHLELDFSKPQFDKKTNQTYLRSQEGFRLGVGGFVAFRVATRQFIRYNDESGKRIRVNQNDSFNVNDVIFGPSAYVGFGDISIYAKYNVNAVFRNNPQDVNSLAIALRFDFN